MTWQKEAFSPEEPTASRLILIIHGLRGSSDQLSSVADAAVEALGPADVYLPSMPYRGLWGVLSATPPARIMCKLLEEVDALDAARRDKHGAGYQQIYIIGYSMGALLARKLAVVSHGELEAAPFEPGYEAYSTAREWAGRIERIVLLGGISKGWSARSAGNWLTTTFWSLCIIASTLLPTRRGMVMEARFGLPFSVQTRLQWLALGRQGQRDLPLIQLLGSQDDFVSPNDMIDVAVDGVANRSHVLLDMPGTGHTDAIQMGPREDRRALLIAALTEPLTQLARHPSAIPSALLSDGKTAEPEDDVTDVVFVVHGIRDKGFWTSKVAREIKREAASQPMPDGTPRHVRSMSESYGYLAMLPFLWIGVRRAKAAWLMDRYVEARARYPRAAFHFVGHSNGTYLAARSLKDYPAAFFDRIVFAGSVVRSNYEWSKLITKQPPQVKAVLNYVASNDLVVGIFPAAFGIADLGGAGHSGFRDLTGRLKGAKVPRVHATPIGQHISYQIQFSRGGHGSGIVETQWDEIAKFIISGSAPRPVNQDYVGAQTRRARFMGMRPPFGFLLCFGVYAGILTLIGFYCLPLLLALLALTLIIVLRV